QEEDLLDRSRIFEQQCRLSRVAKQQGWQDHTDPGSGDWAAPEVAHISIKCLGTGDRQHDGAECQEGAQRIDAEQRSCVTRADCPQHPGSIKQIPSTPMEMNQVSITGPNQRATIPVPRYWMANNASVIARVRGTTATPNRESNNVRPSTA